MRTWLQLVSESLVGDKLHDFVLETLECFSDPFPRGNCASKSEPEVSGELSDFAKERSRNWTALLQGDWQQEVDSAQSEMFRRRVSAVDELVASLSRYAVSPPVVQALHLGLRVRLQQIVERDTRVAIRVRALADFYYSRAVLLRHGISELPLEFLRAEASKTVWEKVTRKGWALPGIWKSSYRGSMAWGPQSISGLKVDLNYHRLEIMDLRASSGSGDSLSERLDTLKAVAGSSGGFFLYSEPDIEAPSKRYDPVGMMLHRGTFLRPPVSNRAALLYGESSESGKGRVELSRVGIRAMKASLEGKEAPLSEAVLRSEAEVGPNTPSIAVVAGLVCAKGTSLKVPLNGFVLPWPEQQGEMPKLGAAFDWASLHLGTGEVASEGISGGPLLLKNGNVCIDYKTEDFWGGAAPLTFSQDETGDRNLLARLAIGLDEEGFLHLVAVDGRQAETALGLSLAGCAAWMQGLGCIDAANMDGGSSKRLMLAGELLDSPTTEVQQGQSASSPVRPVFSGIAIIPRPR